MKLVELKEYIGRLISKIAGEGTLSEGPEYYLELSNPNEFGQPELFVRKEAHLWEKDSMLHPFLNKIVIITGESIIVKHTNFDGTVKTESIDPKEIKEKHD